MIVVAVVLNRLWKRAYGSTAAFSWHGFLTAVPHGVRQLKPALIQYVGNFGALDCSAGPLNADAANQALFANLAAFYRNQRHLIATAANEADTARHAATHRHQAELTSVDKEITRTGTAIDRYLTAFENNTLDPALLQDRLTALRTKTTQLRARRKALTDLLDQVPAAPSGDELDTLADHILDHGTPAQRKSPHRTTR